jgi:hypothetical protein
MFSEFGSLEYGDSERNFNFSEVVNDTATPPFLFEPLPVCPAMDFNARMRGTYE